MIARRDAKADGPDYPAPLAMHLAEKLAALGQEYLERTRIQRKTDRPYFIDKMPNNWAIAADPLDPANAKIIDARRHPLACCFSNFKQHFARGQSFSYDLTDLGRYYADYAGLMIMLIMCCLVGSIACSTTQMVADTRDEVRRLLEYLGLAFDLSACVSTRMIARCGRRVPKQVRRPIFRDGLDQWRQFDPWLSPCAWTGISA